MKSPLLTLLLCISSAFALNAQITFTAADSAWTDRWNDVLGQYEPVARAAYSHDWKGRTLVALTQNWSEGSGAFRDTTRLVYTYSDGLNHSVVTQDWNGSEWVNVTKIDYGFNENGANNDIAQYAWNGNGWNNSSRSVRSYDANGNITLWTTFSGNGSNWVNSEQQEYEYNSSGLQTLQITRTGLSNGWENLYRATTTYNDNDQVVEALYQDWFGGEWVNQTQYLHEYTNGAETFRIRNSWSGNDWEGYWRWTTQNNGAGQPVEVIWEHTPGGTWTNYSQDSSYYDQQGRISRGVSKLWQGTSFLNSARTFYEYNGQDLVSVLESQYWDNSNSDWVNNRRTETDYNAKGRTIKEVRKEWLEVGNQWANLSWSENFYLHDTIPSGSLTKNWGNGQWENQFWYYNEYNEDDRLTDQYTLNGSGIDWIPNIHYYINYITVVGVQEIASVETATVSPNPIQDFALISVGEEQRGQPLVFQLFNVNGQMLREEYMYTAENFVFERNDLAAGAYIYRIENQSSGKRFSGRMMLR